MSSVIRAGIEMSRGQWLALPSEVRRRYWLDTDDGKRPASAEMVAEIRGYFSGANEQPKVDPYFEGEPHPLPLTRAWVKDYKRWLLDGCPTPEEEARRRAALSDAPPDLQELVDRAGRRRTAELGEEYVEDPLERPPHQGGYPHITAAEWVEYDAAMAAWKARRRGE